MHVEHIWKPRIASGSFFGLCLLGLSACGGGGDAADSSSTPLPPPPPPIPTTYTVSGTVSGLSGSGLVLQNNGSNDLAIAASGAFVISPALTNGAAFAVTVKTQPTNPAQVCTATNASGVIASANIGNVVVQCVTPPVSQDFKILPVRMGLRVGDDGQLLSLAAPTAVTWSSSDTAIATVNTAGLVHAVSKGSVVITATAGATQLSSTVTIYQTAGANPDATGDALIAEALKQGRINAETALMYRVFNLFGDARLPTEFTGAPSEIPDHSLLREVALALPTLPVSAQDTLQPFLLPPIYVESWYAQQLGLKSASLSSASDSKQRKDLIACSYTAVRSVPRVTAHFNIFNEFNGFIENDNGQVTTESISDVLAAMVESVYAAETGLFNRFPLADTQERCNGGDGAVDVYVFPLQGKIKGLTVAYPGRSEAVPSFIILNAMELRGDLDHHYTAPLTLKKRKWASFIAHEFLHVLQFAMDRQAAPADYKWFDEATATWAMDFIDGTADFEHGDTRPFTTYRRSGAYLSNYLYFDHRVALEAAAPEVGEAFNGYGDYLFFQFIARKHGNDAIARMFDATIAMPSVEAMASVVESKGGMKTNWPEFAATLWNDAAGANLDYWSTTDNYDFGLAAIYSPTEMSRVHVANSKLESLAIDQKGQRRATFKLLENALEFPGDRYAIQPRSTFYEHLKFTDATVHSVYLFNPIAGFPNREFMKVQARKKIGGQWQALEDWTDEPFKQFCRDKRDERLEELILIVSNSEVNRASEQPFRLLGTVPMQISTSNVGCWQWQGSANTTTTGGVPQPVNVASSGVVTFAVRSVLPGRVVFATASGLVKGRHDGMLGECTLVAVGADKTVLQGANPPDGTIDVNLDLDLGFTQIGGEPPDRKLIDLQGLSTLSTTTTLTCPALTQVSTIDSSWEWLRVEDPSLYQVSVDGQTIEGHYTATTPSGAIVDSVWTFSSMRE